jgi:hypothetical protein
MDVWRGCIMDAARGRSSWNHLGNLWNGWAVDRVRSPCSTSHRDDYIGGWSWTCNIHPGGFGGNPGNQVQSRCFQKPNPASSKLNPPIQTMSHVPSFINGHRWDTIPPRNFFCCCTSHQIPLHTARKIGFVCIIPQHNSRYNDMLWLQCDLTEGFHAGTPYRISRNTTKITENQF